MSLPNGNDNRNLITILISIKTKQKTFQTVEDTINPNLLKYFQYTKIPKTLIVTTHRGIVTANIRTEIKF